MIIFTRTILISFLLFITFYAPYIAYLNHIPNNNVYVLDVKEGESINKVLSKFSDHNFMNKIYINIFIKANNISSIKIGEYSLKDKSVKILKIVNKINANRGLIISSGGISTKEDIEQRRALGADLFQIYTSFTYQGPKVIDDLLSWPWQKK